MFFKIFYIFYVIGFFYLFFNVRGFYIENSSVGDDDNNSSVRFFWAVVLCWVCFVCFGRFVFICWFSFYYSFWYYRLVFFYYKGENWGSEKLGNFFKFIWYCCFFLGVYWIVGLREREEMESWISWKEVYGLYWRIV